MQIQTPLDITQKQLIFEKKLKNKQSWLLTPTYYIGG